MAVRAILYCVKIFDHAAVFALEVQLVAIENFRVAHLLVQEISPVGLAYDNEVLISHDELALPVTVENALDHALQGPVVCVNILCQQFQQSLWADPAPQDLGRVGRIS